MWVSSATSGRARWPRSPRPVSVTGYTSWPASRSARATSCQHQPPRQAPGTSTNARRPASATGRRRRRVTTALSVREPREHGRAVEAPLRAEPPPGQVAARRPLEHRRGLDAQQRGELVEGQDLRRGGGRRVEDLGMADLEAIAEEVADELLLATSGGIDEPVERVHLRARQPNVEGNAVFGHASAC